MELPKKNTFHKPKHTLYRYLIPGFVLILLAFAVPTTIEDFFFPGSQPGESGNLDSPDKCVSCHGGYDIKIEPVFNWSGSMMAQAARDPLYEACLTISNQDVPFSGDLCIRCHSPEGWLGGRSTPTDGSLLTAADKEGIHCDFCHRLIRPSGIGVNPYPDDQSYTENTYVADQDYLSVLSPIPSSSGNGSYIVDSDNSKRGPFADAGPKHKFFYSPYHSESSLCGTCHDVSNPAYSRNQDDTYSPNSFDEHAPSFNTYDLFPVERTFSEWLMSEFNGPVGVYAPEFGGNKEYVSTCQDCHMRDLSGVAANKASAVYREDLPHHDMTGGNTFVPLLVKSLFQSAVNTAALDSAISRARYMLKNAASVELSVDMIGENPVAKVTVTNKTGHKLPSGYPEGRRIWINIIATDISGTVIYESGHYDTETAILNNDNDIKIYEIKPGMDEAIAYVTGLDAGPGFHFVLNNKIFSDNRIPPRGFTNENFENIQSPPVGYTYADGQYWDDTYYTLPPETYNIEVRLYYQAVSREYIDFLRDENITNNSGQVLFDHWSANGKSVPELMNQVSAIITPTVSDDQYIRQPSVYPNPASDWIAFSLPGGNAAGSMYLTINDLSGKLIVISKLIEFSQGEAEFYTGGIKPGIYVYILEDRFSHTRYTGRFIIRGL